VTDLLDQFMKSNVAQFDAAVKMERETLARMWRAVAATPAGHHVLTALMREHIMKVSFDVNLTGQSLEQLAMFGIHRDAQKQLVGNILELAGFVPGPSPTPEQAHDRSSSNDPGDAGSGNAAGGGDAGRTGSDDNAGGGDTGGDGDTGSLLLP
jgi:hypothetical protein